MPANGVPERPVAPGPPRLWTVAEADARLGPLTDLLPRLREWAERLGEVRSGLGRLTAFWGPELGAPDHADHALAVRLATEEKNLVRRLDEGLGSLAAEGIEVKDLDAGIVDFYGLVDGELAYLCWQRGEPAVRFWHSLTSGFRGRRPLPALSPAVASGVAGPSGVPR
jgi:hypothetical protein